MTVCKHLMCWLVVMCPAFLVKYLEQCSVRLNFVDTDASFVFHSMMDVGITLPRLLDIYYHLFKSRVSARHSLSIVWTAVVMCFTHETSTVSTKNRHSFE